MLTRSTDPLAQVVTLTTRALVSGPGDFEIGFKSGRGVPRPYEVCGVAAGHARPGAHEITGTACQAPALLFLPKQEIHSD